MKLKKVLKASFFHKEEPVELVLTAAEIREGKAYLHPKDEQGVTYLVRSDNIEISLSKGFSLSPEHIIKIESNDKRKKTGEEAKKDPPQKKDSTRTSKEKADSCPLQMMNLKSIRSANSLCRSIRMNMIPS